MSSRFICLSIFVSIFVFGCASGHIDVDDSTTGATERGIASWYGEPYHGRQTASGEIYDMYGISAAHRSLDFGTMVEVTRQDSGASVEVRINDRGPFIKGRIIDLSYGAARQIQLDLDGITLVEIRVLGTSHPKPKRPKIEASENSCYWVQIAALSNHKNANRTVETLKSAGEKALAIEGPNGILRIRIGPFMEKRTAIEAQDRLRDEWPQAAIVECGG